MRLWNRFDVRKNGHRDGSAATRLRLQTLEDRAVPSFGFGSAFNVGGTGADSNRGVVRDASGSIYVEGTFSNTVDFDPNDVSHTNSAAILTAGGGFVAKYLSDGTFQWVTNIGGASAYANNLTVQGTSVYVPYLGHLNGSLAGYVSALDASTGAVDWTTSFGPSTQVWSVAVSTTGIVYAAGFTTVIPDHAFVVRLDPASGNTLWTQTSGGGEALAERIAVDAAGNAYATGFYDPYDPTYNGPTTLGSWSLTEPWNSAAGFVWKLSPSGSTVWAGGINSYGSIYPQGIAADDSGNVYVAGYWGGGSNNFNPGSGRAVSLRNHGSNDAFIVKLTPGTHGAMSLGWAKDFGGSGDDRAAAAAVDNSGNIYTTGLFYGTANFNPNSGAAHNLTGGGIFVSKHDANGNCVAAVGLAGTVDGNGQGMGNSITSDGSSNVYVVGTFGGTVDFDPTSGVHNLTSNGGYDAFILKLTQSGMGPMGSLPGSGGKGNDSGDTLFASLPSFDMGSSRLSTESSKARPAQPLFLDLTAADLTPILVGTKRLDSGDVRGLPRTPANFVGLLSDGTTVVVDLSE